MKQIMFPSPLEVTWVINSKELTDKPELGSFRPLSR